MFANSLRRCGRINAPNVSRHWKRQNTSVGESLRTIKWSLTSEKSLSSSQLRFSSNDSMPNDQNTLNGRRCEIFNAALEYVPEYGWTDDALAQGVLHLGYPPASIGLVSSNGGGGELVSFFMEMSSEQLEKHLQTKQLDSNKSYAERLEYAIRTRLEMNSSFVRANRWHEGMATGTLQAPTTAQQLDKLCHIIQQFASIASKNVGVVEHAAIGSIYIGTELHMLMDEDKLSYASTWEFLHQRVNEFDNLSLPSSSPEMYTATTAVLSSLGGAAVSLLHPAAKLGVGAMANTVVPVFMNLMQQSQSNIPHMHPSPGTKSQDYISQKVNNLHGADLSDLPPFETEPFDRTNK
uniref:Ubiquinone biosynthesis protein n=1 Tax=Eucampia antarctica TaxID=49252 RepID=A0A7S2WPD4_9STRA|mmetsp:Transcript_8182/g.7718  ORF Transcript_8182/g.7718 Transcript_8182/m.7718 type:complete len:350 (+) Transcript_8182:2-1051(+)